MTDPDLLRKKLAQVETYVAEIRRLGKPDLLESDLRERRFLEHTLQLAVQAALDIASHVVSDERLGEPKSNRHLFSSSSWAPPAGSVRAWPRLSAGYLPPVNPTT